MDILKPFKKVAKAVKDKMADYKQTLEDDEYLFKCKAELEKAAGEHERFRSLAGEWDELYHGTKSVAGQSNMSNRSDRGQTQDARQVVNIVRQLIEGGIDITVPVPSVDPIEEDDQGERKKMIEGQLLYMSQGTELQRINSENERITKKNSFSVYKVMFDPNHKSHKFRGKIKTTNPHPVNIIPQQGIYRLQDMDHLFHPENRTMSHILRKYKDEYNARTGRDLKEDMEDGSKEYNHLDDLSGMTHNTDTTGEKYSVIEKWYKDEDGDICLITWSGHVILRHIKKFFYKRDEQGEIIETEEVEVMQEVMGMDEQPTMEPQLVQVKCHVPTKYPFVIQYNIPREKSFVGTSDPEILKDQQEGIKKMLSIEEEKLIQGTTKIITKSGSGLKDKISNSVSQILETANPMADVQVVQMHTNENSYKELYQIYLQAAKDSLGITEASQGRAEGGDLSGKALEALASYTAGRMAVKQFEKNIAYTELYQLYYDFLLAYYDEKRPYRIEGKDNKHTFGYFDKGMLAKQDDAGDWFYPEFDIYIGIDTALPKDKRFIMESANGAGDRMDNIAYWTVMTSINFPNAEAILEREKEKEQQAQMQAEQDRMMAQQAQQTQIVNQPQAMDIEATLKQLSPEEREAFESASPEIQTKLIEQLQQ